MLPQDGKYYFTQASTKRALQADVVKTLAVQRGLFGESYPSVTEAYKAASRSSYLLKIFIFIGGSSYIVGDFLKIKSLGVFNTQ